MGKRSEALKERQVKEQRPDLPHDHSDEVLRHIDEVLDDVDGQYRSGALAPWGDG